MTTPDEPKRTIEVLNSDYQWTSVAGLARLRVGDVFRMFEPDGQPVATPDGRTEFVVKTEAQMTAFNCFGSPRLAVEID